MKANNVIQLFSDEKRRALGWHYYMRHKWTGVPPPPSYCTPGLNALLGRSSPGVVDSQSDERSEEPRE